MTTSKTEGRRPPRTPGFVAARPDHHRRSWHSSVSRSFLHVLLIAFAIAAAGCVSLPQSSALRASAPADLPRRVSLDVPFFGEKDNYCGPSSLAMVLAHAGVPPSVPMLAHQVFIPGRAGSLQVEMLAAPRRYGLVSMTLEPRLESVLRELAAGNPVVLLVNYGFRVAPAWHYMVAIGYDLDAGELLVHSAPNADERLAFNRVEYLWRTVDNWSMVALPPDRIPATATPTGHATAMSGFERAGLRLQADAGWRAHLARWPDSALGWFALGNAAYREDDPMRAEAAFRRAIALDPGLVPAINNLAVMVAALTGRLQEAVMLAEQAVAVGGPHQAAARQTLAELRTRTEGSAKMAE